MTTGEPLESGGLGVFRWWYKGRTAEGNTLKLEGRVVAHSIDDASLKIELRMRKEFPTVRWMQGSEIEGSGVTFGPTVQKRKGATKELKKL